MARDLARKVPVKAERAKAKELFTMVTHHHRWMMTNTTGATWKEVKEKARDPAPKDRRAARVKERYVMQSVINRRVDLTLHPS